MAFSENLQYYRARHGITQEQLAERLDVSRQSVSKWESGQSYPEMDTLLKLCDLFGTDLDTLLRGNAESACAEDSAGYDRFMTRYARQVAGAVSGIILGAALDVLLFTLGLPDSLTGALFLTVVTAAVVVLVASGLQYNTFCNRNPVITDFYTQKQKDDFAQKYVWYISGGVGAILLGAALMCLQSFFFSDADTLFAALFLAIVAGAVFFLISGGMLQNKYDIEKYNREHSPEYQAQMRKAAPICGGIFITATAVFLWLGIAKEFWTWCWLVYLPAVVLCVAVRLYFTRQKGDP